MENKNEYWEAKRLFLSILREKGFLLPFQLSGNQQHSITVFRASVTTY